MRKPAEDRRRPRAGLGLAAGLALSLSPLAASAADPPAGEPGTPVLRRFELRYEAVVRDVPAKAKEAWLWLPLPPENAEQSVRDLGVTTTLAREEVKDARYGNRALRLRLEPGEAEQRVALAFEVVRRERVNRDGTRARDAQPAASPELWRGGDRRVPVDGPVAKWARETVGGKKGLAAARAIYDHVVTNLRYDKSGTGWGQGDIFWACDQKRGNCTDFHAVFTGYARAVGIPARFEIGFSVPADRGAGEIAGYHCWAQFHDAERGWVPVDASEASKHPEKREYFFGAHDENRLLLSVGRDLVFPGMKGEPLNFFVYPYVEVDGKPHAAVERRVSYRDR